MRSFIFILMIALVPLRGWMGEAMATEMAAMNIIAFKAEKITASVSIPVAKSMANCEMLKAKTVESKTAKPACNYCQACHATGLVSTVEISSFDPVHYAQPLTQASQFASANIAHSQKPPIL